MPGHSTSQVPLSDRAFQYGDGCFTTVLVKQQSLQLWQSHLNRLQTACSRLHIPFTQWQALEDNCMSAAKSIDEKLGVIKVLISRGSGGRGYSPDGANSPEYFVTKHDYPKNYDTWQKNGIHLGQSNIRLAQQPLLAKIKHLNRLEQVLIKQEQRNSDYDDVLVSDTQEHIIETSAANVFWLKDNCWFTPSLDLAGVEGVMRNHICELMALNQIKSMEIQATFTDVHQASAMFICNSLMGIVPVKTFTNLAGQKHVFSVDTCSALRTALRVNANEN